jgi:hypothetical protein
MKKLLLVLLAVVSILSISAFASVGTTFVKDGEEYSINEKEYVLVCIEGYKWIQFIEKHSNETGIYYVNSGNPEQMFERITNNRFEQISVPIKCVKE